MKLRSRSLSLASNTQFNSTRTSQKRFITPNNGSTSPCITEYRPSLPKLTKIESLVVLKGNNSRMGTSCITSFGIFGRNRVNGKHG